MAAKSRKPKKIAGVTVPRFLRKASLLRGLLDTPMGRRIMAEALIAAAGAAAAVLLREREEVAEAGDKGIGKGARAIGVASDMVQSAAGAVMGVVADAAKSMLPEPDKPARKSKQRGKDAVRH